MSRLRDLLALSDLARWNVVPTSRVQTVAQHSYRVGVISREIHHNWSFGNSVGSSTQSALELLEILEWCMDHDGPECVTGDLPSAFKDSIPDDQLALVERTLCPWYGRAVSGISDLTKAIVGIAEAVESSAWLAQFGLTGTERLVSDLRQKAYSRIDKANLKWPGLGAAARQVAEEVWKREFPLILRKEKLQEQGADNDTTRSAGENGRGETNDCHIRRSKG